jgi:O-methyltransferase
VTKLRDRLVALRNITSGPTHERYSILSRVLPRLHPDALLGEHSKSWMRDAVFLSALAQDSPLVQRERLWNLYSLARSNSSLNGLVVEAGTYRGASARMLAAACPNKNVWCFDSWEGLSTPTELDGEHWQAGDLSAEQAAAHAAVAGYPNVILAKGWLPEVLNYLPDSPSVDFLHIDVDLYEPTRDTLAFLDSRLRPGSVVVCDDYGFETCPGARAAMDDFAASTGCAVLELSTGQGVVTIPPHPGGGRDA